MNTRITGLISHIPGWLTLHESMFLAAAASEFGRKKGVIVEIGSYLGKSTISLAQGGYPVVAVDPHQGNFSGGKTAPTLKVFLKNLRAAGVEGCVTPVIKTSASACARWKKPVSLLFIDGLHDYAHASEDFRLWSPYVIDGGMVAMHDAFCGWDGAGAVAMRGIVYNPDFGEIGVVGSVLYGVRKKAGFFTWVLKIFRQCIIELCQSIYKIQVLPKRIQFILVHRILRVFLINRFVLFRN